MKSPDEFLLDAISNSWRSSSDIGLSVNNAMGLEQKKTWLSKQLKKMEDDGKIERMKHRGRVLYRLPQE